jgi:hypothetical protein
LLNEYHHSKPKKAKPWPEDILRIRATIYKQRHVHSKHIKRKSEKFVVGVSKSFGGGKGDGADGQSVFDDYEYDNHE